MRNIPTSPRGIADSPRPLTPIAANPREGCSEDLEEDERVTSTGQGWAAGQGLGCAARDLGRGLACVPCDAVEVWVGEKDMGSLRSLCSWG